MLGMRLIWCNWATAGVGATDAFGRRPETKRLAIVSTGARSGRGGPLDRAARQDSNVGQTPDA
jgi:type IV pilus assembly protein PilY1